MGVPAASTNESAWRLVFEESITVIHLKNRGRWLLLQGALRLHSSPIHAMKG